jgi:hypothetical protein
MNKNELGMASFGFMFDRGENILEAKKASATRLSYWLQERGFEGEVTVTVMNLFMGVRFDVGENKWQFYYQMPTGKTEKRPDPIRGTIKESPESRNYILMLIGEKDLTRLTFFEQIHSRRLDERIDILVDNQITLIDNGKASWMLWNDESGITFLLNKAEGSKVKGSNMMRDLGKIKFD